MRVNASPRFKIWGVCRVGPAKIQFESPRGLYSYLTNEREMNSRFSIEQLSNEHT